jgi:HK97 family phage major capsid protein
MSNDKEKLKRLRSEARTIHEKMSSLVERLDKEPQRRKQLEQEFDELEKQIARKGKEIRLMEDNIDNSGDSDDPDYYVNFFKKADEKVKRGCENIAVAQFLKTGSVPEELRSLMRPSFERDDARYIRAAVQSTTGASGGYTIPEGFQGELEKAIKSYGGMWEASRVIKTDKGNVMGWPNVNDTGIKGYMIAEGAGNDTDAESMTFGQKQFDGYKYTSGLIQVPNELLDDSELFASEVIPVLAERIYRITNEHFSIADGTDKPNGLANSAVYGVSSANDTALAYDDFVNLKHTVDPGYRKKNGLWMFHDSVLKEAEKIKDTEGRPIFSRLDDGLILGHKYVINQDLPAFTSGSTTENDNMKAIFFGDFSKYIIRQVRNMRIVRLGQRYADLDQTAFMVLLRVDGELQNAGTNPIKYLRVSAT